jgi:hypothetical protein
MEKDYCDRSLKEGEIIMNNEAVADSERLIRIYRHDTELSMNDPYVTGETLTVKISDSTGQICFEATGAQFVGGGCEGRRSSKKEAQLQIAPDAYEDIVIWAGWATGHSTVRITPSFVLTSSTDARKKIEKEEEEDEHESEGNRELHTKRRKRKHSAKYALFLQDLEKKEKKMNEVKGDMEKYVKKQQEKLPSERKVQMTKTDEPPPLIMDDDDDDDDDERNEITDPIVFRQKERKKNLRAKRTSDENGSMRSSIWVLVMLIIGMGITFFVYLSYKKKTRQL